MTSNDDNADDQPATAVAENDATTVVPPPTEAAPELAWSADSSDGENEGSTWLDRLRWVAVAAAVLLPVTAIVLLLVLLYDAHSSRTSNQVAPSSAPNVTTATAQQPPSSIVVAPSAPPPVAAPPTATKPALPTAIEGSACRLQSTPTVDPDGVRWDDYDEKAGTLTISGKVVRVQGKGLERIEDTKSDAGRRTIPLPRFAVEALSSRRSLPYLGEQSVIFPSTAGTLRDPNNFGKQWRKVRDDLGVPEITMHSFRKTVATLIDDEGLSARIGADHLGHSKVSMTQDRYMSRGRVHTQVADLLDRSVAINDE